MNHSKTISLLAAPFLLFATSDGAVIVPFNDFETNTTSWTLAGGAKSGHYFFTDPVSALQPTNNLTTNFAAGGTGSVRLNQSGGTMTTGLLPLGGGQGSETITVSLSVMFNNSSTTRRAFVEYSNDGGTSWFRLVRLQGSGAGQDGVAFSGSMTIQEGVNNFTFSGDSVFQTRVDGTAYNGSAFTNQSVIRVINVGSAGGDGFGVFIDNIQVTSSIPEPASAILGSIGTLLLLRRRR